MSILFDVLAKKGRKGDTKVRYVNNELSHVNSAEAYLIDNYGELGEVTTQTIGSGTINPATGLKEYYPGANRGEYLADKHNPLNTGYTYRPPEENQTYKYSGDDEILYTDYYDLKGNPRPYSHGLSESELRKQGYGSGDIQTRYDANAGGVDYTSGLSELQADDPNIAMMDETSRMMMMQDILKYDTKGLWDNDRAQQWFNLLPTYDWSAEQDLRTKTGEQISQYGISAQDSLLSLARQQDLKSSKRGYAMTGEPTIDRNRENIFADISDKSADIYEGYRDKQQSLQDQFSQDWATKMADLVATAKG
jgi:hypothetical protein